jgi:hypothetical protein
MKHVQLFEAFTAVNETSAAEFKNLFAELGKLSNISKLKKSGKSYSFTAPNKDTYTVELEGKDINVYNTEYTKWKAEYAEEVGGISTDDFEEMEAEIEATDSAEFLDFQEAIDFIKAL